VGILLVVAPRQLRTSWKRLPLFGLLGLVLYVLFPLTFNVGLRYTEASRGAVMLATMPIWSALLGRIVGERLARTQVVGVALSGRAQLNGHDPVAALGQRHRRRPCSRTDLRHPGTRASPGRFSGARCGRRGVPAGRGWVRGER
jgi:EamA-like transporter family